MFLRFEKVEKTVTRSALCKCLIFCILTAINSAGCASFPGKELPTYTKDQITAPESNITASFNMKTFGENAKFAPKIKDHAIKLLTQNHILVQSEVNHDTEYQFTFYFRDESDDESRSAVNAIFSGLTLYIIPYYERVNYYLTVDVAKDGHLLKTYVYREHMNDWKQPLLLFVTPFYWPPSMWSETLDNLTMNFVHDFLHDLKSGFQELYAAPLEQPAKPEKSQALIYVIRSFSSVKHMGLKVYLDDKKDSSEMGRILASQYIYFYVTPGKHQIYAKGENWAEVTIEAKDGDTIFVRLAARPGSFFHWNRLKVIDSQEGVWLLRDSKQGEMLKSQCKTSNLPVHSDAPEGGARRSRSQVQLEIRRKVI